MTQTRTRYDHVDRVLMTAEYGATGPTTSGLDPRALDHDDTWPTAEDILTADEPPISLVENTYNLRGLAEEVRRYQYVEEEVQSTATRTYYDFAGRAAEVHSPGAPVQRSIYDAKGRQVFSLTMVGDDQVTRTETVYDENDRATQVTHFERKDNVTGETLDDTKAIITYRHTWYDIAGRVIATADYGANNEDDEFVNGDVPSYSTTPPTCSTTSAYPLITLYEYDDAGRQSEITHPDCSITRYEYDDLGRMVMMVENSGASDKLKRRVTAYQFDDKGRMIKIAAVLPTQGGTDGITAYSEIDWDATDGSIQVTELIYGAEVIDSAQTPISVNNDWVWEVRYPHQTTGQPNPGDFLLFRYHSDGMVAHRRDERGTEFNYSYDELGRRTAVEVEDADWFDSHPTGTEPTQRNQRITYAYEPDGKLARVSAHTVASGEDIAFENEFTYDALRNLKSDAQSHTGAVTSGTPTVDYAWEFSDLGDCNFNRLMTITYPERPESAERRVVTMNYGDNEGSFDSRLSRVTMIDDAELEVVATYGYMGSSRRIGLTLGNGATQTYIGGDGYNGLDRLGRIIDLEYDNISAQLIHRYQYGYDAMGNREYARVTQTTTQQGAHDNDRSYLYAYDQLQRLVDSNMGALNSNNNGMQSTPIPLHSEWKLDNLGNWSGGSIQNGSYILNGDFNGDGTADPARKAHHATDKSNAIDATYANGTQNDTLIHDVVGNMTRQGNYVYQYDAWNRLVQVNLKGTATFDSAGHITGGTLGALKALYSYDGIGRLIRKEVPLPGESYNRIEDYYYDGVRRIQEVFDESGGGESMMAGGGSGGDQRMLTPGPESAGSAGILPAEPLGEGDAELIDPEDEFAAIQLDEETLGVSSEPLTPSEGSLPSGAPLGGPEGGGGTMGMSGGSTVWTDREYIWGPDYVDECVVQVDGEGVPMYVLQDANYNVVALLDEDGRTLEQYTYTPYGATHIAESFEQHAINRLGQQGLFFERYNANPGNPILVANSQGLYHARNRWYHPLLGRWTTRDPNATAAPILEALAMNGTSLDVYLGGLDLKAQYADGMNLYQFVGSNPVNSRDPLGLFDWWAEVDEGISDITGTKLYALATINEGAKWAALGFDTALKIASSLLPGAGLYDAYKAAGLIASGKGGLWEALDVAAGLFPVAAGAKALLGLKSIFKAKKFGWFASKCTSFAVGTMVDTPNGPVPIELFGQGAPITTRHESDPIQDVCTGVVTAVSRRVAPHILWLTFAEGQRIGVTPAHELWVIRCESSGITRARWLPASHLRIGDALTERNGTPVNVVDVELVSLPTTVYSLEVDGTGTYFVDGLWVHNNVCPLNLFKQFLPFTRHNFRHNLIVKSGFDPGSAVADAHHVFPRKFEADFQRLDINIHDPAYGSWWQLNDHRSNAHQYNLLWQNFLATNPSADQVKAFGRQLGGMFAFTTHY